MTDDRALAALAALAHATRLELVRRLIPRGRQGLAAGEIARALDISASRLSFHLGLLESAGLIVRRRESRHVYYAADTRAVGALIGYLLNDCCQAHPEVWACCASHRPSG